MLHIYTGLSTNTSSTDPPPSQIAVAFFDTEYQFYTVEKNPIPQKLCKDYLKKQGTSMVYSCDVEECEKAKLTAVEALKGQLASKQCRNAVQPIPFCLRMNC